MAFNPFHSFRKHSKVIFAGLTIICMFVFILSSGIGGGGDFFDWLERKLTGGPGRYPVVATMYGEELRESDLQALQAQRQAANGFMVRAVQVAHFNRLAQIEQELPELSEDVRGFVENIVRTRLGLNRPPEGNDVNALAQYQQRARSYFEVMLRPEFQNILRNQLRQIDRTKNPRDYTALADVLHILEYDAYREPAVAGGRLNPEQYFLTVPLGENRDVAEFALWLRKAERMGILLTDEEVTNLVNRETMNALRQQDAGAIEQELRQRFSGLTSDMLLAALRDEFRVRLAQRALLGQTALTPPQPSNAAATTPYEFWEFYRDNFTRLTFALVPVDVDSFLDQVKEEPTKDELQALYNKYRHTEPDPSLERPGFKQPRRLRVQWVGGELGDYYQKRAPEVRRALIAATQFGAAVPGGGFAPDAVRLAAPLLVPDPDVRFRYESYLSGQLPWTDSVTPIGSGRALHDSSVWRPANVAGLVGQLAGSVPTGAPVFTGPLTFEQYAIAAEVRDRVRLGMQLALAPAAPAAPSLSAVPVPLLSAAAPALAALPQPLPPEAVRGRLLKEIYDYLADRMVRADVRALQEKVRELGKGPGARAEVTAYVEQFAKERGLQVGTTSELRDRYAIGEDPALAPLKELYAQGHGAARRPVRFGEFFFDGPPPPFEGIPRRPQPLFEPEWYPDGTPPLREIEPGEKIFLAWPVEESRPRVRSFEEARELVERAWKRQKARELAEKRAKELAEKLKEFGGNRAQVRDFAAGHGLELVELGPVSRLAQRPDLGVGGASYQRYQVEPGEKIEYPAEGMADELLKLRDGKLGATTVVHDAPKQHYYAAALVQREPPVESRFLQIYADSAADTLAITRDPLLVNYVMPESAQQMYQDVVAQLKAEANYSDTLEEKKAEEQ